MIRVGVDAWNLPGDRRGIGRYVRALLEEWQIAFANRIAPVLIVPEWHTWTVAPRYRAQVGGRAYPVRSRRFHRRSKLDALWFPFNGPSWTQFSVPSVATLHDASTFVLPGFDDAARATFALAAQLCEQIVTDSEFSKAELLRVLHLPQERITAIPLGIGTPLPVRPVQLNVAAFGRFALFVGENDPRKGLDTLNEAVAQLESEGLTVPLVVAGSPSAPPGASTVSRARPAVHMLGHVDDATLAALYRGCAVFVYPSRYEGFGLPVLEAMSYGAPVVASRAAAIPEAGGDAALYVPPGDAAALADALRRVCRDRELADGMRERGYARAREMSWRRTAERTLNVLEALAR
jgi:alpha-1,3-rhamnosyl/mannosyltransferase